MAELQCKLLDQEQVSLTVDTEKGSFSGYASVFNGRDVYGDVIAPGAFADVLAGRKQLPHMYFNHIGSMFPPKTDYPARIGRWTKMAEDAKGLFVEGVITYKHPIGGAVLVSMKNRTVDGLSIGYYLEPDDWEPLDGGGRLIHKISGLVEVSIVESPADRGARVALDTVKSAMDTFKTIQEAEALLQKIAGVSDDAARAFILQMKELVLKENRACETSKVVAETVQKLAAHTFPKHF